MKLRRIISLFLTSTVIIASIYAVIHKRDIQDWLKLRNYEPSAEVMKIAEDSKFSDLGKKLFYVNYPDLLLKDDFYGKCQNGEKASVLGCYYSNNKIYVLKVEEDKLQGIEEVTSSHEMLHAAYDRLKPDEKERVNNLLYNVYLDLPESQAKKDIANYDSTDKKLLYNELHSIIGTEVRTIPTELEEYYSRYFNDRSVVVSFAESYDAEFNKLKAQIDVIDQRLADLKVELDTLESDLALIYSAIENEKIILDSQSNDPEAYNAALPSYNEKVLQYRRLANSYNKKVEDYNQLIENRIAIAVINNDLFDAIDTRLPEVTQWNRLYIDG